MKKLLALLFPVLLFAAEQTTIPMRIVDTSTMPEKINGYFQLATKDDLKWFSDTTNNGGKALNAELVADIDFEGDYWIPIVAGNGTPSYEGTFRGNNHTISNLVLDTKWLKEYYLDKTGNATEAQKFIQNSGFVGSLKGRISGLTLDNITVNSEANGGLGSTNINKMIEKAVSVGSIVGWLNEGTVDSILVTGNMSAIGTGVAMGGIVGNAGGGKVLNSTSSVTIISHSDTSTVYIGGIVGYTKKTPTLRNDIWNGEIIENTGKGNSGGIAGYVYSGTVTIDNVTFNKDGVESAVGKACDACKVSGDLDYGIYKIYTAENKKICEIDGQYKGLVQDGVFAVNDNVDSIVFNRKFSPNKFSTLSLPFNIARADIEGVTFYKLYDVTKDEQNKWVVQVTEETNDIAANKPYIVLTEDSTITIKGGYALVPALPDTNISEDGNWRLLTVYKYTTGIDRGDKRTNTYGFVARDTVINGKSWSSGQFVKMGEKAYINPFRSLLEYAGEEQHALTKSRNYSLNEPLPDEIGFEIVKEETTGISNRVMSLPDKQNKLKFNRIKNRIELYHNGKKYDINGHIISK